MAGQKIFLLWYNLQSQNVKLDIILTDEEEITHVCMSYYKIK